MTDPATGAEEGTATATADGAQSGQPQGDTLEQRIKSDPDYALDQYKKVKGESTKLYQKMKGYEAVTQIADQLGGAEVAANLIREYAALAQHDSVAKVREHYRAHGTLPTSIGARTDDTTDEDEYKDPQTMKIEALERQLNEMRNSISQTKGAVGKQSVMQMFGNLKEEYPDGFTEYILPKLETTMNEWDKTPNGREILSSISYDQLKTVAARAVIDNLDAIAELRHARILDSKKRASTGDSRIMSTGREPAAKKGHANALETLNEFMRLNGGRLS